MFTLESIFEERRCIIKRENKNFSSGKVTLRIVRRNKSEKLGKISK